MTQSFDFSQLLAKQLPPPAGPYNGLAKYHFVGGNNDPEGVPVAALAESAARVFKEHGKSLAIYYPNGGPKGDIGLREFLSNKLASRRGFEPGVEQVMVTSGSNHALELICRAFIEPGDTVIVEEHSYSNMIGRIRRHGASITAVGLDEHGIRCDHLAEILRSHKADGVLPKFIFAIPTVQNPTGTVMPVERRRELLDLTREYGVAIIEDECYADLLWDQEWPVSLRAMPGSEHVIHLGSFSKFLAPALRLGYLSAPPELLAQLLSIKNDSGTDALSQMVVADFMREHYDDHIQGLNQRLRAKRDAMVDALREHFGDAAEFTAPPGGIFIWVRLPEGVDTSRLAPIALAQGLAFNPGAEWAVNGDQAKRYLRLCFAHPSETVIREGVAKLAELCTEQFDLALEGVNVA